MKVQQRYEILQPLGRGGFKTVWKARDLLLEEDVAFSVLREPADPALKTCFREAFEREARIIATLARDLPSHMASFEHRVVHFLDYGELKEKEPFNGLFLVTRLVPGRSLRALKKQGEFPLPLDRTLKIMTGVLEALELSHTATSVRPAVFHRDIKPDNIIIDQEDEVTVLDYGIAKIVQSTSPKQSAAMGTLQYMAPEQLVPGAKIGPQTDLFAASVVFHELATGHLPWKRDSAAAALSFLAQAKSGNPPPLVHLNSADLPPEVVHVIKWGLQLEVQDRPRSARHMLDAFSTDTANTEPQAIEPPLSWPPAGTPQLTTPHRLIGPRMVEVSCHGCGRVDRRHENVMRRMVERGQTSCQFCGSELSIPAGFPSPSPTPPKITPPPPPPPTYRFQPRPTKADIDQLERRPHHDFHSMHRARAHRTEPLPPQRARSALRARPALEPMAYISFHLWILAHVISTASHMMLEGLPLVFSGLIAFGALFGTLTIAGIAIVRINRASEPRRGKARALVVFTVTAIELAFSTVVGVMNYLHINSPKEGCVEIRQSIISLNNRASRMQEQLAIGTRSKRQDLIAVELTSYSEFLSRWPGAFPFVDPDIKQEISVSAQRLGRVYKDIGWAFRNDFLQNVKDLQKEEKQAELQLRSAVERAIATCDAQTRSAPPSSNPILAPSELPPPKKAQGPARPTSPVSIDTPASTQDRIFAMEYIERGQSFEAKERDMEALTSYQKGLEQYPSHEGLLKRVAVLVGMSRDKKVRNIKQTIQYGERALAASTKPDAELLTVLARAYFLNGEAEEAIMIQQRIVLNWPKNSEHKATLKKYTAYRGNR